MAAVDCANNPVHVACKSIVTGHSIVGLDGAAMMVLKRKADSATELLATIGKEADRDASVGWVE